MRETLRSLNSPLLGTLVALALLLGAPLTIGCGGDGDGDGDGDGEPIDFANGPEFSVPDCDTLKALYPDAHVCQRSFVVGTESLSRFDSLQPAEISDYAGCEIIQGDVGFSNTTLSDFDFLSDLLGVCGSFMAYGNDVLTDVDGLSRLSYVTDSLWIWNSAVLADVDGLEGLKEVAGGVYIEQNSALDNVDGLSSLTRTSTVNLCLNYSLTSIDGLSSLREVDSVYLAYSEELTSLDVLSGLDFIRHTLLLQNMAGLSALPDFQDIYLGGLWVLDSPITSFQGLSDVSFAPNFTLNLENVTALTSLDGLEGLEGSAYAIWLTECSDIENVDALAGLTQAHDIMLRHNPELSAIGGLDGLTEVNNVEVVSNPQLDQCDVMAWTDNTDVQGEINIHSNGGGCQ